MQVCIVEDIHSLNFLPLVYFRPVYELRCGIYTLRERIQHGYKKTLPILHVRPEIAEYLREELPGYSVNKFPVDDYWFVNGRLIPDLSLLRMMRTPLKDDCIFYNSNEIVAAFISRNRVTQVLSSLGEGYFSIPETLGIRTQQIDATMAHYPWDLVHQTPEHITLDFKAITSQKKILGTVYPGVSLINRKQIIVGKGSIIKPGAVLDAESGPVVIGKNVTVMPNAVIEGPVYIGDHSVVKIGAKIYHGTSVGAHCKIGGEIESSVIHSYSNKQHEGFLGHSYLGSWVNIGADTNTSDLKNNYSTVRVLINGQSVDTGLQFAGLTMGDHSKSGINVMFDTGTNVGVSCNIYGSELPPKYLPSFSWGGGKSYTIYEIEKSIETMRRVMKRRDIEMSDAYERLVRSVFASTTTERGRAGVH